MALARDPSLHLITGTWGDGGLSRAGQADGAELETFLYYLDRFVADYQKANGEPPMTGKPAAIKSVAASTSAAAPIAAATNAPRQLVNTSNGSATADAAPAARPSAGSAAENAQLVQPIQVALREAGYDPGPADGIPGTRTRDAILAFQRSSGMEASGTASGAVLERLLALKPEGPRQ